jgi:hypothetical protein
MSSSAPGPRSSRRQSTRRTPWLGVVLIGLALVLLFGAGFGLSRLIRNASNGGDAAPTTGSSQSTNNPEPCITTTVIPGADLPKPDTVTTNVYNATDRAGLAAATADELKSRGFLIGTVANDPKAKTVTSVAEIRYGTKGELAAKLMTFYIPGATLVNDGRGDTSIDTVLGAAFVSVAAQSEVDKALAEPSPSASGAGCSSSATPMDSTDPATDSGSSTTPNAS